VYVWNINALKKHLVEEGLSEAHTFYYILLFVGLSSVATEFVAYVPTENPNRWNYIDTALSILISIAGTVYAFRANRGAMGKNFAAKYFSIGFVVFIRFLVYLIPLGFVMFAYYTIAYAMAGAESTSELDATSGFEVLLFSAWYMLYYMRVAKHIRDTALA